ncbi:hypothetical protein COCON_G00001230 [Conger conger]|uniref:Ig-like domain-containing protein n=1 Tax=Conger conger TaxID=82655 RepID=A0A9Q1E0Q0_CONCO|nr:hypothetical protein COCON_G00001230 [Conger conger]
MCQRPPQEPEDLSLDPEYSGRVEYLQNQIRDSTFRIKQLRESDSQTYCFRFQSTHGGKYTGQPGVSLTVTALQVRVNPGSVTEGQSVTLTCSTTCTLTGSPAFTWYRDGSPLSFTTQTHRLTASSEDGGTYSCAVKGSELLPSPAVSLTVNYPPKSTSVSVSPSGEIVEGSSVTLTCSSDANPPVQRYTWFKKTGSVSLEILQTSLSQKYTIEKIESSGDGEYYCVARNSIGRGRSPDIHLNVLYPPQNTSVSVSPSGEIVEGSSVTLTCIHPANPPVQRYTWFKNTGSVSLEILQPRWSQKYTIEKIKSSGDGEYYCVARNSIGRGRSPDIHLNVLYPPQGVSVSVSPSGVIEEGSSVTLTCSSDANPPVQRYSWFQENRAVASETGGPEASYTIKHITQQDAGEYYCEAGNGLGTNRSPPKHLDVQYPPKNISVLVSPAGEIEEGSSVTLTCSSDANPPVQIYSWFKESGAGVWQAGSGQSLNFSYVNSWSSGQYYCEAKNTHGAQNSTALLLTVQVVSCSRLFHFPCCCRLHTHLCRSLSKILQIKQFATHQYIKKNCLIQQA